METVGARIARPYSKLSSNIISVFKLSSNHYFRI